MIGRDFVKKCCRKLAVMRLSWTLCFSDKAIFHLDSTINRHNCRIWISQPPEEIIEHQRDMPKIATVTEVMFMNTWCEIEYYFDVLQAPSGGCIETY
jgi:hypothetical protein